MTTNVFFSYEISSKNIEYGLCSFIKPIPFDGRPITTIGYQCKCEPDEVKESMKHAFEKKDKPYNIKVLDDYGKSHRISLSVTNPNFLSISKNWYLVARRITSSLPEIGNIVSNHVQIDVFKHDPKKCVPCFFFDDFPKELEQKSSSEEDSVGYF